MDYCSVERMAAPSDIPHSPPHSPEVDLLSELQRSVVTGKLDVATALWQAASSGAAVTLELVLQLPDGKKMWCMCKVLIFTTE